MHQAAVRLLMALAVATALTVFAAFWIYRTAYDKAVQQKDRDALNYFSSRIMELEHDWESYAVWLKTRLEFMRTLEKPEDRWLKLDSYFTVQSGSLRFGNLLITDGKGRVLYRFGPGSQDLPGQMEIGGYAGWFERAGMLYRVHQQPIWLGPDGMGRLFLFRSLDNRLLFHNAYPETVLYVTWRGRVVASSLGNAGLVSLPGAGNGRWGGKSGLVSLVWDTRAAESPRLVVASRVAPPFPPWEIFLVGTFMVAVLASLLWLALGRWLTRTARRTVSLGEASRRFSQDHEFGAGIHEVLLAARTHRGDELDQVAESLGELMETVVRRDRERGKTEETQRRHMAELARMNAELEEFTYVASHDLQEPLRKLISFSELLRLDLGKDLNPQAEADLAFIVDAAERMRKLVQDLLALSRAGKSAMQREPVRLEEVADAALEALSVAVGEKRATITRDPLPEVPGDRTLLTQLYQNLIGNALKYAGEAAPRIHLTAEREGEDYVFGVRDNGIGIRPEYGEQIFQPFRRLHGRGRYEGTGIGLAICRKVVERHGGRIWVESEEGKGAHFKFTLPGRAPEAPP